MLQVRLGKTVLPMLTTGIWNFSTDELVISTLSFAAANFQNFDFCWTR